MDRSGPFHPPYSRVIELICFGQVDEDLLRKQQAAYSIAGVDEEVNPLLDLSSMDSLPTSHIDTSCARAGARE